MYLTSWKLPCGRPPAPMCADSPEFISQNCFTMSFGKSQFPHKSVNIFFILVMIKDKLTDLSGNRLLQTDFRITFCEINTTPCAPLCSQTIPSSLCSETVQPFKHGPGRVNMCFQATLWIVKDHSGLFQDSARIVPDQVMTSSHRMH